MDMGKYRALFVNEAADQLSQMSALAVALEKDGGEFGETVQSLFRLSHSIKGMAASMDFPEIATLAHAVEDMFSRYDRERVRPEASSVDLVLETIDRLKAMVVGREGDQPLPPAVELVARIRQIVSAAAGTPAIGHPGGPVAPAPVPQHQQVQPAAAPVLPAYQIKVRISDKCQTLGVRGFLVHKKMVEAGTLQSISPSLEEIKAGKFDNVIEAVVATADLERLSKQLRAVGDVTGVDVSKVEPPPSQVREAAETAGPGKPAAPKKALGTTVRVKTETLDQLVNMLGEFILARARIEKATAVYDDDALKVAVGRLGALVRDLSDQVMRVRLMPLDSVADLFPRAVREAARKRGLEVDFDISGRDLETDRAVLEAVVDPIIHILRNCVDHGLETLEERKKAGKPPRGRIHMLAFRDRDTAVIQISDDGRGIDVEKVKAKAVKAGALSAERAQHLSAEEACMLVCLPGVSTAEALTETSGRGVGMSAVKTGIEQVGGSLSIRSEPGGGTTFTLSLPRSIAITNVLLIQAAGRTFSIPVSRVHSTIILESREMFSNRGKRFCVFRDQTIPLFELDTLLSLPTLVGLEKSAALGQHAVIIQPDGRTSVAIAVDRFLGQQEVFIRPLGKPLDRIPSLAGVTILGDGRPVFVLDPARLLEQSVRGVAA